MAVRVACRDSLILHIGNLKLRVEERVCGGTAAAWLAQDPSADGPSQALGPGRRAGSPLSSAEADVGEAELFVRRPEHQAVAAQGAWRQQGPAGKLLQGGDRHVAVGQAPLTTAFQT